MTALLKIKEITALFRQSGIEEPAREAEMLVTGLLNIDRAVLYAGDADMPADRAKHIDALAVRRTRREPLQYLLGHVLFCGLKINVGSGVLIPRPETELLVEETIKIIQAEKKDESRKIGEQWKSRITDSPIRRFAGSLRILDLCTGSGCIALAMARHFPGAAVYGVDASWPAVEYATQNALANNVNNACFRHGDLFAPVGGMSFDCLVSNPPYVRRDEIKTLQKEIRDYEPTEALDGGIDGLDFYRRIFKDASAYLSENGIIMLEIGLGQADAIRQLAQHAGFTQPRFIKDFAGIERIAAIDGSTSSP